MRSLSSWHDLRVFLRVCRQRGLLLLVTYLAIVGCGLLSAGGARAANVTWVGGAGNWVDGIGNNSNWSPADEPDADDTAIFNSADAVTMGSSNSILALTLSGGVDLATENFNLTVDGVVQLGGAGTNLLVTGENSLLLADQVVLNSGGTLQVVGGQLQVTEEAGNGVIDINSGGTLAGHGEVFVSDSVGAATTLIVNDGAITARRASVTLLGPPQVGTLRLHASDPDARLDLDGAAESGAVNINRNQTLDIDIPLSDAFNGTMTLAQNPRLEMASPWTLSSGTITVDNGFVDNVLPFPDIPAGVSTIAGAAFTQGAGTINLVDGDGTLQFDSTFNMTGGTFVANGHVIFNADVTIGAGAIFSRPTATSNLTVGPGATLTINQPNFDLDATATTTSFVTVEEGAHLIANLGDYDPDSLINSYSSVINLNSGDITVNTSDAEFVFNGTLNMHSDVQGQVTVWGGEPIDIGNDSGVHDARVRVTGTRTSRFAAEVDFNSDADVDVAAGATLDFTGVVNFSTVNGGNNAKFTGGGVISFNGIVNVNEAVTLNMVGGEVDLDGSDSSGETINIDAPLTINAATLRPFGRSNVSGGPNILDINNSVGTGALIVNLDDPAAEWTLNQQGVLNLVNDNTETTLVAGADINLNGVVNVTGDVRVDARIDFGATASVTINTAGQPLRLSGGTYANPNTIAGGTIGGAGQLGADAMTALVGFGHIGADIAFHATSDLRASGGALTLGGDFVSRRVLAADQGGILNIPGAWDSEGGPGGSIGGVVLAGGTLQGGTITNNNTVGIQGFGLITSPIINNTKILAANGGTLVLDTPGNDNDWDGALGTGSLEALSANLELHDDATTPFSGTVRASNGFKVSTQGFGFNFGASSKLILEGGGDYSSSTSTTFGGMVTVGPEAGSTIQVAQNTFLTFAAGSTTTLNNDLALLNNNIIIKANADFAGPGSLVIPDGSHWVADNQADIGVIVDMQGAFRPGNSDGVGRIGLLDYQQRPTGKLFVELTGTSLNQYDRLVVDGVAQLDGYLNIDIDGPFVPMLNDMFVIVAADLRVGEFDYYDVSGMPENLAFHVDYQDGGVVLQVVEKMFFEADFDDDGDVDITDYLIWKAAYGLNQLGDANGDNISDARDFVIWRNQLGSKSLPAGGGLVAARVPEPRTLVMGLVVVVGLLVGRRRSSRV